MTTVDFATFCNPRDIRHLAQPGEFERRVLSHDYKFSNVFVVRQRCGHDFDDVIFSLPQFAVTELFSEDYPDILDMFHIPEDARGDEMTHGPTAPHYWKWHCINHLVGLLNSDADYMVFSDSDCRILNQPSSWIDYAIYILQKYPETVLIVGPSDGGSMAERVIEHGEVRLTQNVSQQMFCCDRKRLVRCNFNEPWDGNMNAPGGPFQEFYWLLEGRLWRIMHNHGLYRAILPEQWRYWHDAWH